MRVLYPRRFELFRLEALGDPPYRDEQEARAFFEEGRGLFVVAEGSPPAWSLQVSEKRFRFSATFYASSGTPLRAVTWERHEEGLLCRRSIDLFYPDGDPGRRLPYGQVLTVTRDIFADGVVQAGLSSPAGGDDFRQIVDVPDARFRLPAPAFGDWEPLVARSTPAELPRFGLDAIDAAIGYQSEVSSWSAGPAGTGATARGWRVLATVQTIMEALESVLSGAEPKTGVVVVTRGPVRILPLATESPSGSEEVRTEQIRRISVLADALRDACENREGQAIAVDLAGSEDRPGSYASALRAAGATKASYWVSDLGYRVMLVWTRESRGTSLAFHVVPSGTSLPVGIDLRWSLSDGV